MTSTRQRLAFGAGALAVFGVELAIALGWIGGRFVRESVGDVLAVVFVHGVLRAVGPWGPGRTAAGAVAVGFVFEGAQAVGLADALGLARGSVARIVLGDTFAVGDLAMYLVGGGAAWLVDRGATEAPTRWRRAARGDTAPE